MDGYGRGLDMFGWGWDISSGSGHRIFLSLFLRLMGFIGDPHVVVLCVSGRLPGGRSSSARWNQG